MPGFKWSLCNYVGGNTAVKPSFKQYTLYDPDEWAAGEFTVQPRDFSDISISCGFRPAVVMFICFRPRLANNEWDVSFGARGGGMTYGAAGLSVGADLWDDEVLYSTGELAKWEGAVYQANNANLDDEPPSANWDLMPLVQFSGSSRFQQGWDINIGSTTWREDSCLNVIWRPILPTGSNLAISAFTASASMDAGGFTLSVSENLYDQTDTVFWLAMSGNYKAGVITSGDAEISGFHGTPRTAVFMSMKHLSGAQARTDRWDAMIGMASPEGNFSHWGGGRPVGWNFTTSRWNDADSILFASSATGSSFVGASVEQTGQVVDWHDGGVDLTWPVNDGGLRRIGYIMADQGTTGYLETNWTLRPEVVGENFEDAAINPKVILMTGTNYYWNPGSGDPLANPALPNAFIFGGSTILGWHIYPYSAGNPNDAWAVSAVANAVQERGHYSNSSTQIQRNCIAAGAGTSSSPPAQHQHGVNVLPSPRYVGLNYRFAERHAQIKRIHINISDRYLP